MNRLHLWYENIFKKDCIYKFQTFSVCKFPSLKKIAVNINNNEVKNILPSITTLELITSQKPVFYTAKKSIAAFKLREGVLIGSKV
jgi:large subunit ribosomal protein L5